MLKDFGEHVFSKLNDLIEKEEDNIRKSAELIYQSINSGNNFLITGSGHSHMIAEEIYARAGGYANIKPILEPELMLHDHPLKSTLIERLSGYADILLLLYKVKRGDSIVIVSNSGRNSLPVELALGAKQLGANVIAITNVKHSRLVESRHKSGKRLMDIADVVIDNHGDYGDASYKIGDFESPIGATSTITGSFIAQALINEIVALELKDKGDAPVFRSSNIDGSDDYNKELMIKYNMV